MEAAAGCSHIMALPQILLWPVKIAISTGQMQFRGELTYKTTHVERSIEPKREKRPYGTEKDKE